jgi:hypothetical protein
MISDKFYLAQGSVARVMKILYARYPSLGGCQTIPWDNSLPAPVFYLYATAVCNTLRLFSHSLTHIFVGISKPEVVRRGVQE